MWVTGPYDGHNDKRQDTGEDVMTDENAREQLIEEQESEMMNQLVQMFKNSNERMKTIASGDYHSGTIEIAQREAEIQSRIMNQAIKMLGRM